MANVRKRHTAEFKAKVALEAIRQQKTTNELITAYAIQAAQISTWKKQALAAIPLAFSSKKGREQDDQHIVQRNLSHSTPVQTMKEWYRKKPELFKKRVYNQSGLDTLEMPSDCIPLTKSRERRQGMLL